MKHYAVSILVGIVNDDSSGVRYYCTRDSRIVNENIIDGEHIIIDKQEAIKVYKEARRKAVNFDNDKSIKITLLETDSDEWFPTVISSCTITFNNRGE